jgi:hypothetical protein
MAESGSALNTIITSVNLQSTPQWSQVGNLNITNEALANIYLKSMLGSLPGKTTLGKDFPVNIPNATITFNESYISFSPKRTSAILIE